MELNEEYMKVQTKIKGLEHQLSPCQQSGMQKREREGDIGRNSQTLSFTVYDQGERQSKRLRSTLQVYQCPC